MTTCAASSLLSLFTLVAFAASLDAPLRPNSTYTLRGNNIHMPVIGLGVYRSDPGRETYNAVAWALQQGYRLIDTAAYYENEASVGQAIRESDISRKEIFVTTKLMGEDHGYDETMKAFETSRKELGLDHVDLYLIHSPFGGLLIETWDALLELQRRKLVRSIGVSNFGIEHLEALVEYKRPLPSVNQIEMHPLIYRERQQLVKWCQDRDILIQAYGSILSGYQDWLEEEPLASISHQVHRTPAQVLLRWALQHGFQIIPKSIHQDRIQQNMQLFDFQLSDKQMQALDDWSGELDEYWDPVEEAEVEIGDTHHWQGGGEEEETEL